MPLHIQLSGGQQLRQGIALIKGCGFLDLRREFRRHGRVGLVVAGVMVQDLRVRGPVFIELRRKLDEVAGHGGARQTGILRVGEHSMQSMAKLMKHGRDVLKRDEGWLARGRFGEVGDVVDNR